VIVGDGPERPGESDAEGRQRETLITMFSPGGSYTVLAEFTDDRQTIPMTSRSHPCSFHVRPI
jgi:hypothetical protein